MTDRKTRRGTSIDGFQPTPELRRQAAQFPAVGITLPSYNAYTGDARAGMQAVVQPTRPQRGTVKKRFFTKKRITIILVILVMLPILWLGGKFLYNLAKVFKGGIFNAFSSTQLKGEDRGRVNILLAGNSADDPGHQGASLTDSIMILSIDTKDNTAFMLSVPRDLWVEIPGYGHHKINEAYNDGEDANFRASGYPEGGMGMLEKVINDNLGIQTQYYALINYRAFRQAVDAVGGIDVTIKSSDPRGLYDPNISPADGGPLKITNGTHHLDGTDALNLARARGDSYYSYGFPASDFDRTNHQRQMLMALKDKITSSSVIANPVALSKLMDAMGDNVKTDLKLNELRRLSDLGKQIGNDKIKSLSLNSADGKNLLASYTSSRGESALIPAAGIDDFSDIQRFIRKQMSNSPVVKENASVVLLNGTDTYGLAGKHEKTLEARGLNVIQIADARQNAATTTIINNTGTAKPATLALMQQIYGNHVTTTNAYASSYDADYIVILGADQTQTTSTE